MNKTVVRPGSDSIAARAYMDYARHFVIDHADFDAAGKWYLPIEAGEMILGVRACVLTAFNGTSPTLIIGDSADDNKYLVTTDLTLTDTGKMVIDSRVVANGYEHGKYYAAADYLVLFSASYADCTAGVLGLDVYYSGYRTLERDEVDT